MTSKHDPLSLALEELRDRPIVTASRDFANEWEQSSARARRIRTRLLRSIGALAAIGITILFASPRLPTTRVARDVYETKIGESRHITLEDGSRVMLDTSSRMRVAFSAAVRDVELLEGQAHFDVAKNPARPFRVRTRFAEVVAVGTSFDVTLQPTRTRVTLIEGRVNVRSVGESRAESLTPGQQLDISSEGRFVDKKPVGLASVTSWQRGTVVLDDVLLSEALTTLNRYSSTQIAIEGHELQARRVSGVFVAGDVETEALVLKRFLGLRECSRTAERITLCPSTGVSGTSH